MPFPPCPLIRYLQLATVQPDGRPANRTVVFRWDSYRLPCTACPVPPTSCGTCLSSAMARCYKHECLTVACPPPPFRRGFLGGSDDLTFITDRRSRKVSRLTLSRHLGASTSAEAWLRFPCFLPSSPPPITLPPLCPTPPHPKVAEVAANPAAEACWYFTASREQYRLSGDLTVVDHAHADAALLGVRRAAWAALSDAGRGQFAWPSPREPRVDDPEAFSRPAPGPQVGGVGKSVNSGGGGGAAGGRPRGLQPPGPWSPCERCEENCGQVRVRVRVRVRVCGLLPCRDVSSLPLQEPPLADFCLVVMRVHAVDYVQLFDNMREAMRQDGDGQWLHERINP